jgi:hypothetical protein
MSKRTLIVKEVLGVMIRMRSKKKDMVMVDKKFNALNNDRREIVFYQTV